MFEWDRSKARENEAKQGVSFADTFAVFDDPNAMTIEDLRENEQRYVTIGMDAFSRVLVVVYTWRGESIRIISARKAVRFEVKQYEGQV
ncbi:MAG TPA: BrnT family toxin [bacterium]|nr:BrnT family toxin [bacterium]